MERNEKKLIKLVKSGDKESFGVLYNIYITRIYNYIFFKTHHTETAEDLTSLTFSVAFQNVDLFDEEKKDSNFNAWLYRIARNNVIDYYRKKKVDYNIDDAWDISSNENIEMDVNNRMKIEQVKEYLKNLSSPHRDIVIMRIWQQMSYKEIAGVLGKTESSCKMAFSRIINQLRKDMPLALFIALILNL